jgi:hypothetical protein
MYEASSKKISKAKAKRQAAKGGKDASRLQAGAVAS